MCFIPRWSNVRINVSSLKRILGKRCQRIPHPSRENLIVMILWFVFTRLVFITLGRLDLPFPTEDDSFVSISYVYTFTSNSVILTFCVSGELVFVASLSGGISKHGSW